MMNSLGDLLRYKNFTSPFLKGVRASQVVAASESVLKKIFGDDILAHVHPAFFKNQTLAIACLSSTAAQELKLHETQLLRDINNLVPGAGLAKIRYLS